jgi:hypothetical protein
VQALAELCVLLYVATVALVGVRMLLLARKTGGRPELLLGAGSLLVVVVGLPTSIASGFGKLAGEVHVAFWAASEFTTQMGVVLLYLFAQQVFRAGVPWARNAVIAVAVYLPFCLAGAVRALAAAAPETDSVAATRGWLLACFAGYGGCFLWSALESLLEYRMAVRRQALGLADPVVASRFFLFALYALAATGIMLANAAAVVFGFNLSSSLVVLGPSAALGLVSSAAIYFAFLPPRWYLARLRAGVASS